MIVFAIILAGYVVADAIMFVKGYRSYIFTQKPNRKNLFEENGLKIVELNGMKNYEWT